MIPVISRPLADSAFTLTVRSATIAALRVVEEPPFAVLREAINAVMSTAVASDSSAVAF